MNDVATKPLRPNQARAFAERYGFKVNWEKALDPRSLTADGKPNVFLKSYCRCGVAFNICFAGMGAMCLLHVVDDLLSEVLQILLSKSIPRLQGRKTKFCFFFFTSQIFMQIF